MKALSIEGLTTDEDIRWLAAQAARHRVIVEIGSFRGRSTRALADATPGLVYAIDNWNLTVAGRVAVESRAAFMTHLADLLGAKVIPIERDSQAGVPVEIPRSIDMLWIDGDHEYAAVASDIRRFAPRVRRGGLICGHDYSPWHPGVVQAVDEAFGARVRTVKPKQSIWWVTA